MRNIDENLGEYYFTFLPLFPVRARTTQINNFWPSYTPNMDLSKGFICTPIFDDNYDVAIKDAENYAFLQDEFAKLDSNDDFVPGRPMFESNNLNSTHGLEQYILRPKQGHYRIKIPKRRTSKLAC